MKKIIYAAVIASILYGCGSSPGKASFCAVSGEIIASSSVGTVQTENGKVSGYVDDGIFIYKGIPYAKAERFMPPAPADRWEGIRSCRAYGPTAPQGKRTGWYSDEQAFAFNWNDGFADEDCLRVNIWSPGVNDGKKRPVMVWLHGGGYAAGSGQELPSYDGLNLAKSGDVVVVTLNHRLNILGFLDLSAFGDRYSKSGNAGLLDLIAALEWVRDNITAFGGDPDNVTIFGQSGGGGKVTTLMATPSAKGLFHKAIVQSGSMLNTMTSKWSRRIGATVVRELGISPNRIDEIKKVPYDRLLAAGEKAIAQVRTEAEKEGFNSFIFGWAPTVDNNILPHQLGSHQACMMSKDIPMIIGTTLHEFTTSTYAPQMRKISENDAMEYLKGSYGDKAGEFASLFRKTYPDSRPVDLVDTDFLLRPTALEHGRLRARMSDAAPVYMYLFGWESPVMDGILRSTHCMEIPFVFNNAVTHATMTGGGPEAVELADKMSKAWVSFARTGNPSVEELPQWNPYTLEDEETMYFDNECSILYGHDRELTDFVRQFPIRGL